MRKNFDFFREMIHIKMKKYCDDLSKHRNFNWKELWNEY